MFLFALLCFGFCIGVVHAACEIEPDEDGHVDIPPETTSIGDKAYESCENLKSITFPDSLTSIGEEAFKYCMALTDMELPPYLTSIGQGGFQACVGLTSIVIPETMTEIGPVSVYYPDFGKAIFGVFKDCQGLTSVTLPSSLTGIGFQAFYGCIGLTSFTIPDSVTEISYMSFAFTRGLTSLTIPDSVTSIGKGAFHINSDSKLASITIPCSVTFIAENAFFGTQVPCIAAQAPDLEFLGYDDDSSANFGTLPELCARDDSCTPTQTATQTSSCSSCASAVFQSFRQMEAQAKKDGVCPSSATASGRECKMTVDGRFWRFGLD